MNAESFPWGRERKPELSYFGGKSWLLGFGTLLIFTADLRVTPASAEGPRGIVHPLRRGIRRFPHDATSLQSECAHFPPLPMGRQPAPPKAAGFVAFCACSVRREQLERALGCCTSCKEHPEQHKHSVGNAASARNRIKFFPLRKPHKVYSLVKEKKSPVDGC